MTPDVAVHLGLITLDLRLDAALTLKDKRRIVKSVIDRVRARLDVCIAEVGFQDVHGRSILCAAAVSSDRAVVQRALDQVRAIAESRDGAELADWWIEWR